MSGHTRHLGLMLGLALGVAGAGGCSDSNDDDDGQASGGRGAQTGGMSTGGGSSGSANGGSSRGGSTLGTGGADGSEGGAGAQGGADGEDAGESVIGDRRIPYTPASDAEFAAFFVEHHRMAIDMANVEIAKGASANVKVLATSIRDTQTAEVRVLEAAQMALGIVIPRPAADPHMEADMAMMHAMSGAELDAMFLQDMIAHHAAGLAPAHRAMPHLARPELQQLAMSLFSAQANEIGTMKTLLVAMGVDDPGQDLAPAAAGRADFGLRGDRRVPLTPDDLTFIDFFVPHHRMAIDMAELAIALGGAEVKQMATMMRDAQTQEVEAMLAVRLEIAGSDAVPAPPHDVMMMAEMERMKELSGAAFDQRFLEEMIPHHAAGIPTAHRARPHLENPTLDQLAADIFNAQAREVGEMETLLESQ